MGQISAEVLEVYRVTAAHDGRDPLAVLRERGLRVTELRVRDTPIRALYTAARDYLLQLNHMGAAEVRAGLTLDPGPARAMFARQNAVTQAWLEPALALVAKDQPHLAGAIRAAAGQLAWGTYDACPLDQTGKGFAKGHAFAPIFAAHDFDLGLFLIAPHVLYRDHAHPAPALYAPLTGPHGWRFGVGRPLITMPAHQPVWNPPHRAHLTKVGAVPFLGLFVWTKDVDGLAYVLPADDWAALEDAQIA